MKKADMWRGRMVLGALICYMIFPLKAADQTGNIRPLKESKQIAVQPASQILYETILETRLSKLMLPEVIADNQAIDVVFANIASDIEKQSGGRIKVNYVWMTSAKSIENISLDLYNLPALDALKYIAQQAGLTLKYDRYAILIQTNASVKTKSIPKPTDSSEVLVDPEQKKTEPTAFSSILLDETSIIKRICESGVVANTYSDLRSWDEAESKTADIKADDWNAKQKLAKDPPPGTVFARVRPGFIALHMNWRSGGEFSGVQLLRAFAEKHYSVVKGYDFTSIGNSSWWNGSGVRSDVAEKLPDASKLQEQSPRANWILKDPFDGSVPILSNRRGEMVCSWVAPSKRKLPLAIVKTAGGYFFGYLSTADPLSTSDLTWEAATRKTDTNWKLVKGNVERLDKPKNILTLVDNKASKILAAPFQTLDRARVLGPHLERLLEGGMTALLAELMIPAEGDGIESPPKSEIETESGPGIIIERITDEVSVMNDTRNPSAFRFQVMTKQRVRETDIKTVSGRSSTDSKHWRNQKQVQPVEISPDLDGGIRFTNGQKIIELVPDKLGRLTLVEWTVEQNKLKK